MAKKRVLPAILCVALLAAAGWYAARALTIHPAHFSAPSSISVRLTRFCGSSPVNLELRGQWSVKTEAGVILLSGSDFRGVLAPDPTGLLLGARLLGRSPCILATRGDGGIRLGDRAYTGALRVEALPGRSGLPQDLDIVLELPLEDYVLGVVCGEMPSSAPGLPLGRLLSRQKYRPHRPSESMSLSFVSSFDCEFFWLPTTQRQN